MTDDTHNDDEMDPEAQEPEGPPPPMEAEGAQLSLNLGNVLSNRSARTVESAKIVLQGGERGIDSLLDPDRDYDLLVRVRPDMPAPVAVRDSATEKVKAVKLRQTAQTKNVQRADTAVAISGLYAALLERDRPAAVALLDELTEAAKALRAVA